MAVSSPSGANRLEATPIDKALRPLIESVHMTITRDDPRFWDVRTLERKLRRGLISKKEFEKYLKALDDVASKMAEEPQSGDSKPDV